MHDLGTLVNLVEALLSNENNLRGQSLSVLNKVFLQQLHNIVGTTAHSSEVAKHLRALEQIEVSPESFIHNFVLNKLPEFVVLEVHASTTLDGHEESWASLSIETGKLLLDERQDNIPKLRGLLKFVLCDEVKSEHNLLVGHVLAVLLVYEHNVVCVLGSLKGEVDLVEDE